MSKIIRFITAILLATTLFGVTPTACSYDLNTNILELTFDVPVRTDNVILGLLTFDDGITTLPVSGGTIITEEELSNILHISLIYGAVIDERANADENTSAEKPNFKYWGNTNELATSLEEMSIINLNLNIEEGAFVDEEFTPIDDVVDFPVQTYSIEPEENSPQVESVAYYAGDNLLQITFNRHVQFDQIAEDRTCENGQGDCPGNETLDGTPAEDGEDLEQGLIFGNNNGVLDMEVNIDIFKVGFTSSNGTMFLEGFRSVAETEDSEILNILISSADAKKIELDILADTMQLRIDKGGFVDTFYNPNQLSFVPVEFIADTQPLELTEAIYQIGKNEFELKFDDSRNVTHTYPPPVYSKISVSTATETVPLTGIKQVSSMNKTLYLKELLFRDQSSVEQLIFNAIENDDPIYLNLDEYAMYDVNGNGNNPVTSFPLVVSDGFVVVEELLDTTYITYNYPLIDTIYYSSSSNRIEIGWSPDRISYYHDDLLTPYPETLSIDGIVIIDSTSQETFAVSSLEFYRDQSKENTYLGLSFDDAGRFETLANEGHEFWISIDPYVFYTTSPGYWDNNGNLSIFQQIQYATDVSGPHLQSARLDLDTKIATLFFDKNISLTSLNMDSLNLIINDVPFTISDFSIQDTSDYFAELDLLISDTQFDEIIAAIPFGEIIDIRISLQSFIAANIDTEESLSYLDLNGDGIWDSDPEPFEDYGSDGIPSELEEGYPGSCSADGVCSDPQYGNPEECESVGSCSDPDFDNEVDCLAYVGSCSIARWHDLYSCESHNGVWTPDPEAWVTEIWFAFDSDESCTGGGEEWTENIDPVNDDYDPDTNPDGTEGNGIYDFGETFTDENNNGSWDELTEPNSIEFTVGRSLWNESHRAFPDAAEQMYFAKRIENDDVSIYVEEAVWSGICHDEDRDIEIEGNCLNLPDTDYINGKCVYLGITSEEQCLAKSDDGVWTQVLTEDVDSLATFYSTNKADIEEIHGQLQDLDDDGKLTIGLYDISDEFGKGANDTNSSLFTHGYFSLYADVVADVNLGDFIFLDVGPQIIDTSDASFGTMKHAFVNELTKMLIEQNEPFEDLWLKEGLALFEQLRILGNVRFFGDGTDPSATAGNQLDYITFSKRTRNDQHNIYLFLTYLFEKYTNDNGWDIIDEIAANNESGFESIDEVLESLGFTETVEDIFIDYAAACWLDCSHLFDEYNDKYSIDAVNIYAPPANKGAGVFKFTDDIAPPYNRDLFQPWSFKFYLVEGLTVSAVDNGITIKSPLLAPTDTLIFDGYDGIDFRVKKVIMKNGFIEDLDPLYEIVDFEIDTESSKGWLPVTTNSITLPDNPDSTIDFSFKSHYGLCSEDTHTTQDSCEVNGGTWTWYGNQLLALIVAKVDDTQPPASYDFVLTNVTDQQDYSNFYILQNPGVQNFLDLYVVSQNPIYNEFGIEGPSIQIYNDFVADTLLLESIAEPSGDFTFYYNTWQLGTWDEYWATYEGMDQNGISVESSTIHLTTTYTLERRGGDFYSPSNLSKIYIPDDITENIRVTSYEIGKNDAHPAADFSIEGLTPFSNMTYFGPAGHLLKIPIQISFNVTESYVGKLQIYYLLDDEWINLGGELVGDKITAAANQLGYFIVASGTDHLPVQESVTLPDEFVLSANYPNPFNPSTRVDYYLPHDGQVEINIFNIRGQLVHSLVDEYLKRNWYSLQWLGFDNNGHPVPSGVYFLRLEANDISITQKMVLMK